MSTNIDYVMMEWLRQNPDLQGALFQFLGAEHGSIAVVPIPGESVDKRYIDGTCTRTYDFALQLMAYTATSADGVNEGYMEAQRSWQEWIETQELNHNYPDFGENCYGYRLELLDNMPNLAQMYEGGLSKYQFVARLRYTEKKRRQQHDATGTYERNRNA